MISTTIETRIRMHIENFIAKKIDTVIGLSMSDFELNPFFIATVRNQLQINTPRDLAQWLIQQRMERSMVTGFGSTLQNIAKEFSNEKPLPHLTAKMTRNGKTYNLIIKSGPKHNLPVTQSIQRILLNTKNIEPDSIPIFGMCYGNEDSVGGIVKKYASEVKQLVGKDFWKFLSNDPTCYDKILKIATDVGTNYRDKNGNSLAQVLERKMKYMEKELKKLYSDESNGFWNNVLGDAY